MTPSTFRRPLAIATVLVVAFFAGGCSALDLAAPEVDLVGVGLESVGLLESVIALELRVDNPNPFRLPIERGLYTLFLEGRRVGIGSTRGLLEIPARSSTRQEIVIELDNLELLRRLRDFGRDDEVAYRIEAEHIVRGFGSRSLRSVSEGDVSLRSDGRRGI
jgi:LEA14-like dessication related protein